MVFLRRFRITIHIFIYMRVNVGHAYVKSFIFRQKKKRLLKVKEEILTILKLSFERMLIPEIARS